MKLFIPFLTTAFLSLSVFAYCQPEAQFTAKVARVEKDASSMHICRVYVSEFTQYSESGVCPLFSEDVSSSGIIIGMKDGHTCEYDSEVISGYLVKNLAGQIYLE